VGDAVRWLHEGRIAHTVTSEGAFDSGTLQAGDTFETVFDAPGTFTYVCLFHSNMRGAVTVTR
jgi:plastocyanin